MVNELTQARQDIATAINDAGLKAYDYVQESFTPPACIVVPDNPFITAPVGDNPFRQPYSVAMQVVLIGGKGTNQKTATQIDSMIVNVIDALDEDWDITEVGAPQEVSLKGVAYLGALITLKKNTSITKEVI